MSFIDINIDSLLSGQSLVSVFGSLMVNIIVLKAQYFILAFHIRSCWTQFQQLQNHLAENRMSLIEKNTRDLLFFNCIFFALSEV